MFNWNDEISKCIKDNYKEECKKRKANCFKVNYNKNGKGILILGINPAGDDLAALNDQSSNLPYFYYIGTEKNIKNVTYNKYFKPLYELANSVFDNNVKWDWCNTDWNEYENIIATEKSLKDYFQVIKKYYDDHKSKEYTLYVGDLIYIHETKQGNILDWLKCDKELKYYIKNSFNAHLNLLIEKGVKDLIIYINNAQASQWIAEIFNSNKQESCFTYEYKGRKYPIVLGSMIQGQRAMDVFSRDRLIKELKSKI